MMKIVLRMVLANRVFLLAVICLSSYTSASKLTYACYPNTTIKVENPGDFTHVFANNSQRICDTTWTTGKDLVYIDNCDMDDKILVHFSYLDGAAYVHVIGGDQSHSSYINCAQIPSSGEFRTINISIDVSVQELKMTTYPPLDPEFELNSGIYTFDPLNGYQLASEALVGTPLFWIMKSTSNKYRIRPEECWAYAGKNVFNNVPSKLLYFKGCTRDESLLTNFMMLVSSKHLYYRQALLYSFKFYGSDYVTMRCKVRVCPFVGVDDHVSFCEKNTCLQRRKRDVSHALGDEVVTVWNTFRIITPSQISGSGRFGAHTLWLVFMMILHLRCVE